MIGLYDLDLYNSKNLIPNLEIMKLAKYYSDEEGEYCRLLLPTDKSYEGYKKIFVCSEDANHAEIPYELKKENIITHGAGFTKGKYVPFDNKLIEIMYPSTSIYKEYLSILLREKQIGPKEVNDFLDSCYYRMYVDNKKLPIQRIVRKKPIYIYDADLTIDEISNMCEILVKKKPSRVSMVHATTCNTISQFIKLRNAPKFSRKNEIILDMDVPSDEICILFKKFELLFKSEITKYSNVFIPIGGDFVNKLQFYRDFDYKMNLLFSFISRDIPIKLKFIESPSGINKLETLEKTVVKWLEQSKQISLNEYVQNMRPADMREASIKAMKILTEYNKEIEKIFSYEKQGIWRV